MQKITSSRSDSLFCAKYKKSVEKMPHQNKNRVTARPRSLNSGKAIAEAICHINVYFSTKRTLMNDVAFEFSCACSRKESQKKIVRTPLKPHFNFCHLPSEVL